MSASASTVASVVDDFDFSSEAGGSAFSFSGEVQRQARLSSGDDGEKGQGILEGGVKRRKIATQQLDASKLCRVEDCQSACAQNKQTCWVHKRAQDVLYNMYVKGKDPEGEEAQSYFSIFGKGRDGPPDPKVPLEM